MFEALFAVRIFVYEYTCAAGQALPPSLRAEGWAMLSAVLADFNRVAGMQTVTLLAEEFPHAPAGEGRRCCPDEQSLFHELAAGADWSLVIAPEFDGILAERGRWVLEAGGRLLGPAPTAVELTADKLRLADLLRWHAIPTPRCHSASPPSPWLRRDARLPLVLKPRNGAGSLATCLVRRWVDLDRLLGEMKAELPDAEMLLQPLVPGEPASVAILLGPGQEVPLPPASQLLSADGRFRYLGGVVPLPPALARRATELALRAVQAVPDLRGYVGVDLILGPANNGSADQVIEINPRLTTSYIGLRALTRDNLAEAMLRVVRREPVEAPVWGPGPIRFRADGTVVAATER